MLQVPRQAKIQVHHGVGDRSDARRLEIVAIGPVSCKCSVKEKSSGKRVRDPDCQKARAGFKDNPRRLRALGNDKMTRVVWHRKNNRGDETQDDKKFSNPADSNI